MPDITEFFPDRRRPPDGVAPVAATPRADGATAYALAALSAEAEGVRTAGEGGRNHRLNQAAFSLGQLISGGEISEDLVVDTLTSAALMAGLDPPEIRATLRSGIGSGRQHPRTAPDLDKPAEIHAKALTGAGPSTTLGEAHSFLVQRKLDDMRANRDAKRALKSEETAMIPFPEPVRLDTLLAEPDEPAQYRIDRLWPVGGRIVLAAQYKTGKTSIRDNLIRSLVDGEPFLDNYPVTPLDGSIYVLDFEMPRNLLRTWLREQDIRHPQRVHLVSLRGSVGAFDITSDPVRARWVQRLREAQTQILILDCLGPVLAALGMDDNKAQDVGVFLAAFDQLLTEAGVAEGLVIHHMGHEAERSRGSSRLRDWPDAEWKLIRERTDENDPEPPPDARRYFSATGRDVGEPESLIHWDPVTRRIHLVGGTRKDTAGDKNVEIVVAYVRDNPGVSQNQIERDLTSQVGRNAVRAALRGAIDKKMIFTQGIGKNGNVRAHYVSLATAPPENHRSSERTAPLTSGRRREPITSYQIGAIPNALSGAVNSKNLGPCAACGELTVRYGDGASPLCNECKASQHKERYQ